MALSYGFCLGATSSTYTSAQFSEAFHALIGDGITPHGDRFALTVGNGFEVSLGTGFAIVDGRWLKSDEPFTLTLLPSYNTADRYDAVAVRADYESRKVSLEVLPDIDPDGIREDPAPIRGDRSYSVILYLVHVKRGATVLYAEDIEDTRDDIALCGYITPLSDISADVLYVYRFLVSGIDEEVARLIGLSEEIVRRAEAAIADLKTAISGVSGAAVGDVTVSLSRPRPAAEWLPCDGSAVAQEYPALSAMLGGVLPDIRLPDVRYGAWIYGGAPTTG